MLPSRLSPILRGTTPLLTLRLRLTAEPAPEYLQPGDELPLLDLTGGLVTMVVKAAPESTSAVVFTAVFVNAADPQTGVCSYRFTALNTDRNGMFYAKLTCAWSAGPRAGQILPVGSTQLYFRES